jgi:ABC-type glycerol-3-phosphate transport system substrate-binding protein
MSRFSMIGKRVAVAMAAVLGAAAISAATAAPADAASRWVTYTEEGVPIVWEHCYTWEAGGYYGTCGRQL